jgi:hypothetical protein
MTALMDRSEILKAAPQIIAAELERPNVYAREPTLQKEWNRGRLK